MDHDVQAVSLSRKHSTSFLNSRVLRENWLFIKDLYVLKNDRLGDDISRQEQHNLVTGREAAETCFSIMIQM